MRTWIENKKLRNRLKIALLIFWVAAIFVLSSFSSLGATAEVPLEIVARKLAHFFEYAVLVFLLYKVIAIRQKSFVRAMWWAVGLTVLYAISDEIHQAFVAGRTANPFDVVIDIFGMLVAVWLMVMEREHQLLNPRKRHVIKI